MKWKKKGAHGQRRDPRVVFVICCCGKEKWTREKPHPRRCKWYLWPSLEVCNLCNQAGILEKQLEWLEERIWYGDDQELTHNTSIQKLVDENRMVSSSKAA